MSRKVAFYEYYKIYEMHKIFDDIQGDGHTPKHLPENNEGLVNSGSGCISIKELISQGYLLDDDWEIYKAYIDLRDVRQAIKDKKDRKALREMLHDAKEEKFDLVVVRNMSRISRMTSEVISIVRMLRKMNVEVYFKEENIWTMHEESELQLHNLIVDARKEVRTVLFGWCQWPLAKKENGESAHDQQDSFPEVNLNKHVKRRKKLRTKMENGILVGSHRTVGYDYDSDSKSLTINEPEAMVVRYIFDRYISGVKGGAIARELNEQGRFTRKGNHWNSGTVLSVIENEKYKGDISLGKGAYDVIRNQELHNYCYIKDHHVPIVSPEVFDKAQRILNERRGKNAKRV